MRRLRTARKPGISRRRRHGARRRVRRHSIRSRHADEARELEIELSILSSPQPISADAVEIGRHGLLISMGGRRGLLLPQVPVEHHWDRITFLEQTCRKAGPASGCVAEGREHRGVHRRDFRRKERPVKQCRGGSGICGRILALFVMAAVDQESRMQPANSSSGTPPCGGAQEAGTAQRLSNSAMQFSPA